MLNLRSFTRQEADPFVVQALHRIRSKSSQCPSAALQTLSSVRSTISLSSTVLRDCGTIDIPNGGQQSHPDVSANEEHNLSVFPRPEARPAKTLKRSLSAGLSRCLPRFSWRSKSLRNYCEIASGQDNLRINPVMGLTCPNRPPLQFPPGPWIESSMLISFPCTPVLDNFTRHISLSRVILRLWEPGPMVQMSKQCPFIFFGVR